MTPEYTVIALVVATAVVLVELCLARTGLFRQARYWAALAIMFAFQIPMDGWLTKLSAPIVSYQPNAISGLRAPWDIPLEDFVFGFALITLTLVVWKRLPHNDDESSR